MEQAPGGHGASSRRGEDSKRLQRRTEGKKWRRSTYTTPRRYHHGMARQCPRSHDGIKLGEVTDDTSMNHLAHQAQISPRTRPSSSRSSSRSPWPRSRASEVKGMRTSGSNRQDLTDRRNHCHLIYRADTISAVDSGETRQNRARRWRGDAVARGSARGKTVWVSKRGVRPVGLTKPLVGFDQKAGAD
jgi:hypothetical protein